jgi:hypothetical protein
MIDKTLAYKVLIQEKLEKAKWTMRAMKLKAEAEEQLQKKVEPVKWLEDHICNLHERHLPLQY